MIGAEHLLAKRCRTKELGDSLLAMISGFEESFRLVGENPRYGNPTPGNKAGGITTLEEKSLGCIHKAGTAPISQVVGYAKPITQKGLAVMDTPGQDIASIAGMAAAGAQAVVFTTGHGTPTGFGILPVIKITANSSTAKAMQDHIDFDCSDVLEKGLPIQDAGEELMKLLIEVCEGRETKAELLGFNDMSMARVCNFA